MQLPVLLFLHRWTGQILRLFETVGWEDLFCRMYLGEAPRSGRVTDHLDKMEKGWGSPGTKKRL